MERIIRSTWVDALTSGEFNQGNFYLSYDDENGVARCCPIGVLAKVSGRVKFSKSFKVGRQRIFVPDNNKDMSGTLSIENLEILGLSTAHQRKIVYMNDIEGRSFVDIAQWISSIIPIGNGRYGSGQ